jgi:TPR repeat protein
LILILGLAAPAQAGPLEDGLAAAARGDHATALQFIRPLAEQGVALAQYHLGFMYHNHGRGVTQDYGEAAKWYHKAADQGLAPAQNSLGFMYSEGRGVRQDYLQAYKWYILADMRWPASETATRDMAGKNRERVAALMTPAQIAEAERLAREWRPQ